MVWFIISQQIHLALGNPLTMTGDDINATIATGDVFSPTMIVAKGANALCKCYSS